MEEGRSCIEGSDSEESGAKIAEKLEPIERARFQLGKEVKGIEFCC